MPARLLLTVPCKSAKIVLSGSKKESLRLELWNFIMKIVRSRMNFCLPLSGATDSRSTQIIKEIQHP